MFEIKKTKEYKCISCLNNISVLYSVCPVCNYDQINYYTALFFHNTYFNDSLDFLNKKKYFEAYTNIIKYTTIESNDVEAEFLKIYLLNKLKKKTNLALINFENKFPMNKYIKIIDEYGLGKVPVNSFKKKAIKLNASKNQQELLKNILINEKNKTLNLLINTILNLYDFKTTEKKFQRTFDNLVKSLETLNIFIKDHDGEFFNKLSDDEKMKIEVKDQIKIKAYKKNQIKTIKPAIYINEMLFSKEEVIVSK